MREKRHPFPCSIAKWAKQWGLNPRFVKSSLARGYSSLTAKARRSHPLYSTYEKMICRCYIDKKGANAKNYGQRGIRVCGRWFYSFDHFAQDMGPKPGPKYSLDRIDVNKDYSPDNCRWATWTEQLNNKTNSIRPDKRAVMVLDRKTSNKSYRRLAIEHGVSYGSAFKYVSAECRPS